MNLADEIFGLFESKGHDAYFGERVSQLEHALQAAWFAGEARAGRSLIVAALLHDIGHLVHGLPESIADEGIDGRHEAAGEAWLRSRFGPEVTEPVRLHVDAKRYLCRVDANYLAQLSPSSVLSLQLQGGPFNDSEAASFEANPFFREAVQLRRWDDAAKIPEFAVPGLEHYRAWIDEAGRDA